MFYFKKNLIVSVLLTIFSFFVFSQDLLVYTEESPPLNFTKDGKLDGQAVEIVKEIMKRIGKDYKIDVVPWARGYNDLLSKENVVLFSTTRTEEREKLFKWVGPVAINQWIFYARKSSGLKINSLEDAKKVKAIGTYIDDVREKYLIKEGFQNLESVSENHLNVKKLINKRIDLWISGIGADDICKKAGIDPKEIEPVFVVREMKLYIAFSIATKDEVIKEWQNAYDSMKKDGTIKKINDKWGLPKIY
ncbi:MAG TPA: ABC transporter substrate-binding protein [Spirochaetota bacterium]|nr:ABC transporter substrate-binding protein [Spirochaetota bacterium]